MKLSVIFGIAILSLVALLFAIAIWVDTTTQSAGKLALTACILGCWGFLAAVIRGED